MREMLSFYYYNTNKDNKNNNNNDDNNNNIDIEQLIIASMTYNLQFQILCVIFSI